MFSIKTQEKLIEKIHWSYWLILDLFGKDRLFRSKYVTLRIQARSANLCDLSAINAHEGAQTSKTSFSQRRRNDCLGHPVLNWGLPTFPITRRKSPSFGFKSGHRICTRRTIMGAKAGGRIEECAKGKSYEGEKGYSCRAGVWGRKCRMIL